MPRKGIQTQAAELFGSETMARLMRSLVGFEGKWVQQAELARSANVDPRTAQKLLSRLENPKNPKLLEVNRPFENVVTYRLSPKSNLYRGLKMIFEELER